VLTWRRRARRSARTTSSSHYLEIIELGPGVFGIEAASQYWFGREARRLTPRQAAFLAALTPEPRSWHGRLVRAGRIDDQSLARIEQVLRQMKRTGAIDKATYEVAILAPLTLQAAALRPAPAVARR
jgi:penicillin-binding protein 1A